MPHSHCCFFYVADVHTLTLYNCYSNSLFKSSLELMFVLNVSPTQNKSCLVFSYIVLVLQGSDKCITYICWYCRAVINVSHIYVGIAGQ